MKKPVFVVLRKYFYVVNGVDTPFTPDGGDIVLFGSYESAKEAALKWCHHFAKNVTTLCDYGEISADACQIDDMVMQCVGRDCFDGLYMRVGAEVYQKYVL